MCTSIYQTCDTSVTKNNNNVIIVLWSTCLYRVTFGVLVQKPLFALPSRTTTNSEVVWFSTTTAKLASSRAQSPIMYTTTVGIT